ncbi:hypothetical protein K2173_015774 [Erythroxylum novogranatense]|uniref:Sulphate adenylyltransferase catalytic domain-containing protein n=1 Tax=Erythroxylum novogranatense TaxID=1862640 RepID=A0AAV8TG34_9ROSI|nr:hypothetical protein K2173_015774 [Erythroxylum novogranatense]
MTTVGILSDIEIYKHPKEERIAIIQGTTTPGLLYVEEAITNSGNWLIGGDLEVIEPIKYNDGLDRFRLSPAELREEFAKRNADAILAFQLRNPVHNGHGNRKRLLEMGYKNPMLLLHPLGGYTKADDFPLSWRMRQHEKKSEVYFCLDRFRLSPAELREEFAKRNADAILAFQLRNPVHNGHGNRKRLLEMGYKNPMLLLHPLGGYTKADDFPLSWRMRQHEKKCFSRLERFYKGIAVIQVLEDGVHGP